MIVTEIDDRFYALVRKDYESLENIQLRANPDYWEVLKPQTLHGHAVEGHGAFRRQDTLIRKFDRKTGMLISSKEHDGDVEKEYRAKMKERAKKIALKIERAKKLGKKPPRPYVFKGQKLSYKRTDRRYPNSTIYDICEAIGKNPFEIASQRQEYIDRVLKFIHKIALNEPLDSYKNSKGEPLCDLIGLPTINNKENLKSFLNGVYLAYCMDSFNPWRKRVFEKYGIGMGGGEIYFGNIEVLDNLGLTLDDLATEEHTDEDIYDLFQFGALAEEGKLDKMHEGVYVRRKKGGGSIDDLAIVIATMMWGEHGGIGVTLNDAVDTLDKFIPYIIKNGQDELIGRKVAELEPELDKALDGYKLPSEDLIVDMMAVIAGHNYTGRSHSSQRYLNQIDAQTGQTALESHLNFAQRKPYKQMFLCHPSLKISNKSLYQQFREKFKHFFPQMKDLAEQLDAESTWDELLDMES